MKKQYKFLGEKPLYTRNEKFVVKINSFILGAYTIESDAIPFVIGSFFLDETFVPIKTLSGSNIYMWYISDTNTLPNINSSDWTSVKPTEVIFDLAIDDVYQYPFVNIQL